MRAAARGLFFLVGLSAPAISAPVIHELMLTSHGITGSDKDVDGDGLAHLVEYALGLNPLAPEPFALAVSTGADGQVGIIFAMAQPAAPDARVELLAMRHPGTGPWEVIASKVRQEPWSGSATLSGTAGNPILTETPAVGARRPPARWYRLRVSLTPAP